MPRQPIPTAIDRQIRKAAQQRCGYCHSPQHLIMVRLEIEHIIPVAQGGTDNETNLWLACPICNGHKSDKISALDPDTRQRAALFNPRTQLWSEHFRWSDDGILVIEKTPIGRATVIALHLSSDPITLTARKMWVTVGWHPPKEE